MNLKDQIERERYGWNVVMFSVLCLYTKQPKSNWIDLLKFVSDPGQSVVFSGYFGFIHQ